MLVMARFKQLFIHGIESNLPVSTSKDLAYFSSMWRRVRIMFYILEVRTAMEKGLEI